MKLGSGKILQPDQMFAGLTGVHPSGREVPERTCTGAAIYLIVTFLNIISKEKNIFIDLTPGANVIKILR